MRIILATNNISKIEQIKAIFAGSGLDLFSLAEAKIESNVEEGIESLEENAGLKSMDVWRKKPWQDAWTMADDTGLFIDALGGEPGVITADWAGKEVKGAALEAFAIKKIRPIPEERRRAVWRTVAAVREPSGNLHIFTGESGGKMIDKPQGILIPEFPYSRIFVPEGENRTWSQMSTDEQNAISHRGLAFSKAREYLLTKL